MCCIYNLDRKEILGISFKEFKKNLKSPKSFFFISSFSDEVCFAGLEVRHFVACALVRLPNLGFQLCVNDGATERKQLVNRKRGVRRNECTELVRKERHAEISLCQNQFPRPRVHFISQRADSGTHATAWLGLAPSSH